jgi:hypothetical protein
MRLAIDTSSVSFRRLGSVLIVAGVILLAGAVFDRMWLLPGLVLCAAGLPLRGSHRHLVRRRPADVLRQLARTLDLMAWRYDRQGDSIMVPAANAVVEVRPLAWLTLLSFKFGGRSPQKERYLEATLVKYQRFT